MKKIFWIFPLALVFTFPLVIHNLNNQGESSSPLEKNELSSRVTETVFSSNCPPTDKDTSCRADENIGISTKEFTKLEKLLRENGPQSAINEAARTGTSFLVSAAANIQNSKTIIPSVKESLKNRIANLSSSYIKLMWNFTNRLPGDAWDHIIMKCKMLVQQLKINTTCKVPTQDTSTHYPKPTSNR